MTTEPTPTAWRHTCVIFAPTYLSSRRVLAGCRCVPEPLYAEPRSWVDAEGMIWEFYELNGRTVTRFKGVHAAFQQWKPLRHVLRVMGVLPKAA